MKIEKISFKNFGSYGNKTLNLDMPADPSFFLVQGKNGNGKCLHPTTKLKVICNPIEAEKFNTFLKLYNK